MTITRDLEVLESKVFCEKIRKLCKDAPRKISKRVTLLINIDLDILSHLKKTVIHVVVSVLCPMMEPENTQILAARNSKAWKGPKTLI